MVGVTCSCSLGCVRVWLGVADCREIRVWLGVVDSREIRMWLGVGLININLQIVLVLYIHASHIGGFMF